MPVSKSRKLHQLRLQDAKLQLKWAWAADDNEKDEITIARMKLQAKIKSLSD